MLSFVVVPMLTLVGAFPSVNPNVLLKVPFGTKALATVFALVGLFPSVSPSVCLKVATATETLATKFTLVRF